MEAGFEGTVCARSWLSPVLRWQKFKQTRSEGAPSPGLETSADHVSSPGRPQCSLLPGAALVLPTERSKCPAKHRVAICALFSLSVGQERFG